MDLCHVFEVERAMSDQIFLAAIAIFAAVKNSKEQGMTDEQVKTRLEKLGKDMYLNVSKNWPTEYIKASAEGEVQFRKDFVLPEKNGPGRTVWMDMGPGLWAPLPKVIRLVPPIDEGLLEWMSKWPATDPEHFPATVPEHFQNPWGTGEKLYKAEAVDPFGTEHLLGIYATKEETQKAFKEWGGLKPRIVEMDCDADRSHHWMTVKEKVAAAKGERFENPSPYKEYFNLEKKTKDDMNRWK
jgi:hypothetical protein